MFRLEPLDIVLIVIVLVVVFGGGRLASTVRAMRQAVHEFRNAVKSGHKERTGNERTKVPPDS